MTSWIVYALISAVAMGALNFLSKLVGTGPAPFIAGQFLVAGFIMLPFALKEGLTKPLLWTLLGVGLLSLVANIPLVMSIKAAPNPGYAYSFVVGIGSAVVFLLSYLFLGSEITLAKLGGVALILLGVFIVSS